MILFGVLMYDLQKYSRGKYNLFFLILILLIIISGLAYRLGGDGIHYLLEYSTYSMQDGFGWEALNKYKDRQPGWVLLIKICRTITEDYALFKMIHALIVNILIARVIKKYTSYLFSGLLLYFVLMYFDFNFQILRQSLAIAVFLSAIPYFEKNKWFKYYLISFVAFSFHTSALICFVFPLIKIIGYNKKALFFYLLLMLLFIINVDEVLIVLLNSYTLSESTAHIDYYAQQVELGLGFSFFLNLMLSVIVPFYFIYLFSKKGMLDTIYPKQYIIITYGLIYTVGLYVPILYRFNHYFILFLYLFYIEIFYHLAKYFYAKFKFSVSRMSVKAYFVVMILAFTTIKARFYLSPYGDTPYPTWVQYYPYSSVLFEAKNDLREDFFRYIN